VNRFFLASLTFGAALAVGCATEDADQGRRGGSALTRCVPNQTLVCVCGLDKGAQTCDEQGRLSRCECPSQHPDAPIDFEKPPPGETSTACGNGRLDPGEACDDGNAADGDGCSSTCQPDGAPKAAEQCPGQALTLTKGSKLTLVGTTAGFADDVQTSCFASHGPDRVYAVQPSANGFMTVDAAFASGFNAVVEVRRSTCTLPTAQVLCEDTLSRPFKSVVQVEKDKNYFLIIDGDTESASGAYTIVLDLQ
jgi:cysteine-rich repeat protein